MRSGEDRLPHIVLYHYSETRAGDHAAGFLRGWKAEYAKLTAEQKTLNGRYLALKDEVKEAEQIRRSVYDILRREERGQQPRKAQEVDR